MFCIMLVNEAETPQDGYSQMLKDGLADWEDDDVDMK